jgi:hypothetical protein
MLDRRILKAVHKNKNMAVPWYLILAYAYYKLDDPLATDTIFDWLGVTILRNHKKIEHRHKHLLTEDQLRAGTYLGEYPSIVQGAAEQLIKAKNVPLAVKDQEQK